MKRLFVIAAFAFTALAAVRSGAAPSDAAEQAPSPPPLSPSPVPSIAPTPLLQPGPPEASASPGAVPVASPSVSPLPSAPPPAPAPGAATPFPTIPPDVTRTTYNPTVYVEVHIDGAPAWNQFVDADRTIADYSFTLRSHEVQGSTIEDRVYHFAYMKPSFALSNVISGRSAGTGAVWHGGNKIKGHLSGLFAHLKAIMQIDDPRALDLRGKTIVAGFFPWIINGFELASGGKLTESPGPVVDGVPTTTVSMRPLDPKRDAGCTTEEIMLSSVTHLPVEHDCYVGSFLAEHEIISDMKVNLGLTPGYFDFI